MNTKILFLIAIFLVIGLNLIVSQDVENIPEGGISIGQEVYVGELPLPVLIGEPLFFEEETDISPLMGIGEGQITVKGVEYSSLIEDKTMESKGAILTFVSEDSKICINDDCFENILSQEEADLPSFVKVDENAEITKAAFTVNENGGNYVIRNEKFYAPPKAIVFFDQESGIITIKVSGGSEIVELPKAKVAGVPSDYITTIESITGNFELPDGIVVSGKLGFEDGQIFVPSGDFVSIKGIDIRTSDEKTNLFFDGKRHDYEGDYVSFGENNLIIANGQKKASTEDGVTFRRLSGRVTFSEGNPFLDLDESDFVGMQVSRGGEIEIQNRNNQGLIPSVRTRGDFLIFQDSKSIFSDKGKISMGYFASFDPETGIAGIDTSTTSPIELVMFDENGKPLLNGNKIIVDNSNRIGVGLIGKEEFIDSPEGIDVKFSSRIDYNNPTQANINTLMGRGIKIHEDLPEGQRKVILGSIRDYWKALDPEVKSQIGSEEDLSIEFVGNEHFKENYPNSEETFIGEYYVEYFFFIPEKIVINADSIINNPETLRYLLESNFLSSEESRKTERIGG